MRWPGGRDYVEALQSPALAFVDSELKTARVAVDAMGLPRPFSGTFGVVFEMESLGQRFALKCFTQPAPDLGRRYRAIQAALDQARLPHTVAFRFYDRGVRVQGNEYPALLLQWAEGEPLHRWVQAHRRDAAALRALADRWLALEAALRKCGIAHGDLQHGNVRVRQGELVLIDYDGMYVPALDGQPPNEIGHRHWQHPRRGAAHFGPQADSFAAFLVWLSLQAIAAHPDLLDLCPDPDDALLFVKADLEQPAKSRVLARLRQSPSPVLCAAVGLFHSFLASDPDDVPALAQIISHLPTSAPAVRASTRAGAVPEWMKDHVPAAAPPARADDASPALAAAWMATQAPSSAPLAFTSAAWPDRLMAISALLVPGLLAASGIPPGSVVTSALVAFAAFLAAAWTRFQADPGTQEAVHRRLELKVLRAQRDAARSRFDVLKRERATSLEPFERALRSHQARIQKLDDDEHRLLHEADKRRHTALAAARAKRSDAEARARTAESTCAAHRESELRRLEQRAATRDARRTQALAAALDSVRARVVEGHLRACRVASAAIPDVGEKLKDRLRDAGITTAWDVDASVARVSGFGGKRVRAMLAWRTALEAEAGRFAPAQIPATTARGVTTAFDEERQRDDSTRAAIVKERQLLSAEVARTLREELDALTHHERIAEANHSREREEIVRRVEPERTRVAQEAAAAAKARRDATTASEARLVDARRALDELVWRCANAEVAASSGDKTRFSRWLRRIVLG